MISIVIPSYNNLRHLKNAFTSIKKHAPEAEVILYDDASTDGTWEWLEEIKGSDDTLIILKSDSRVGHTVLYDKGIQAATNNIVGIMHADMIMGPNYVENMLKYLKPLTVVCGTRIEPPLHPEGAEKLIQDFGMDFNDLNIPAFEEFTLLSQEKYKGETTKGMFAPWILYKEDFLAIGGHDWGFAPFPYEDSDIFQRWLLNGYSLVQARDAFVYHLTCRGHRWTGEIGKNDDYFYKAELKARTYYIKKWGSWIKNNEYQYPTLIPVYKKCAVITNYTPSELDDWFTDVNPVATEGYDVVVKFDFNKLVTADVDAIRNLNEIVEIAGQIGDFEVLNLTVTINSTKDRSYELIKINNE